MNETGVLVEGRGLRKRFGEFEAVRGIDVSVCRGEVFGFLGPNGAGKSWTMRMIASVSPRVVVECFPVYHGVALLRGLSTGTVGPGMLGHVGYLVALALVGIVLATRRLASMLLR